MLYDGQPPTERELKILKFLLSEHDITITPIMVVNKFVSNIKVCVCYRDGNKDNGINIEVGVTIEGDSRTWIQTGRDVLKLIEVEGKGGKWLMS